MDNKPPKNHWATSLQGRILGYLLATAGFFAWVIAEGQGNGGYYAYPVMAALESAAVVAALCYLAAVARPFSDKRFHAVIFGIVFLGISLVHAW